MKSPTWRSLFLLLALIPACAPGEEPAQVAGAVSPGLYSGLIPVAEDQGYFRSEKLDVHLREFESGHFCLDDLISGHSDLATVSHLAFAGKALDYPGLKIIASIASMDLHEVLCRLDQGISSPVDLQGKRIGITFGTSGEFYLDSFLLVNGISASSLTILDIPPSELPTALHQGIVDAICSWDMVVWRARQLLKNNILSWDAQNYLYYNWLLVMREDAPPNTKLAVNRFLQSLLQAQKYCILHKGQAKAAIRSRFSLSDDFVWEYWDSVRYNVTLDQALIVALEDAFRWRMAKTGRPGPPPMVLDLIDTDLLDSVDSRAVAIYR